MFKESELRQVHPEGSAGGSYAASVEVSPPPAGTILEPIRRCFYTHVIRMQSLPIGAVNDGKPGNSRYFILRCLCVFSLW